MVQKWVQILPYDARLQARSDTLKLGWRDFEGDKMCKICNDSQIETLTHFILDCPKLQMIRNKQIMLQLPRIQNHASIMKIILLHGKECNDTTNSMLNLIQELWSYRNKLIQEISE